MIQIADLFAHSGTPSARAEHFYRLAISTEPESCIAHGSYAWYLHTVKQDGSTAHSEYEKAIGLDPSHLALRVNYAYFLRDQHYGRDEVVAAFESALQLDPLSAGALGGLCHYLAVHAGELDLAIDRLQSAISAGLKSEQIDALLGSLRRQLDEQQLDTNS